MAQLLQVSLTTIRNWERRHGHFPKLPAYEADLRDFSASIKTKPELSVVGDQTKPAAEERYRDAKAALAEVTLQEKTGELVSVREITNWLRRAAARHTAIKRDWPDRVAKRFREHGHDKATVESIRSLADEMAADLQMQIPRDLVEHAEEDVATDDQVDNQSQTVEV